MSAQGQGTRDEQSTILSSIHSLTNFCFNECLKEKKEKDIYKLDGCIYNCARNVIERRFWVRERWM